jgi:lysophospholipase L1-like esterase
VALALAIVAFWLEGAPRLFFGVRPLTKESIVWRSDPTLGWAHEPNARGLFVKLDCNQEIVINSRGLREREIGYEKPPGTFRILALGNSVAVGFEVPPEAVFTRVLEDELNRRGVRAQVINAACRGWGSDQSLLYLEREGLKYHPDLVLYCIGGIEPSTNLELHKPYRVFGKGYLELGPDGSLTPRNVPVPSYPMDAEVFVDDAGRVVEQPCSAKQAWLLWFRDNVVTRSAACTMALETLSANPLLGRLIAERAGAAAPTSGPEGLEALRRSLAFRTTVATYRAMKRDAESIGARFALCNPATIDIGPGRDYPLYFAELGQDHWDLGRDTRATIPAGTSYRLKHDAHFNEAGHAAIGRALADGLIRRGLVPAPAASPGA